MKFQVGDKVVIQHSNDEGEVLEIINDKMVLIDVRGVKFPAYTDQLDFPYFKRFTEKKLFPEKEKKQKKFIDQLPPEKPRPGGQKRERIAKLADGVWLTYLPVFENDEFGDEVVDSLKIHLANNTAIAYQFSYHLNYFGKADFELDQQVGAYQDFYLHDIPFANLNDNPVFETEFSLVVPDKTLAEHYETTLKLKGKQVFNRIEEIKKNGEATFSYKLFDTYPFRVAEAPIVDTRILSGSGFRMYEASRARQHLEAARSELDLHIEKLVEKWQALDNFEILTIQLQTFEKYFDLALAHHLPSMIVIHGVGSGKLRDEIHELLRTKRQVKSFVNRYDPRYGYGATEIFFQY